MQENPFEQTTLPPDSPLQSTPFGGSTLPASGNAIELRYQPAIRILVPAAIALGGIIAPIILFISSPKDLFVPVFTAIMEFSAAAFMYFFFNSAFVRADDAGVTKSQFGKTQSVRWEEIADMGVLQVGNGPYQVTFKDASGKEIFKFSTLGSHAESEKLWEFIDKKLEKE